MIIDIAKKILSEYSLCPNCLGRQFAVLLTGTSNRQRGESILLTLGMDIHKNYLLTNSVDDQAFPLLKINFPPIQSLRKKIQEFKSLEVVFESCFICKGLFSDEKLDSLAKSIVAHSTRYEFNTFLVGCFIPPIIAEREEFIRSKFSLQHGETLKSEFNREIGKLTLGKLTGKEVEFNNPEILFIVDIESDFIKINSNPLFIEGSYRKLVRGIPQAIWLCNKCQNKGCDACNQTGRNYPDSVEEYITPYILQSAKGLEAKIHCSGREDVDALMLGHGRPFVVEISQPKIRTLDLVKLEELINASADRRVDVTLKGISNRKTLRSLKGESTKMAKRYRMMINTSQAVTWDLEVIKKSLIGKIKQQTPQRVIHRRADLLREREVYDVSLFVISSTLAEIEIHCEGGLYVKELMHGDNNRTIPSLADILQVPVKVVYLDVLEVEHELISV